MTSGIEIEPGLGGHMAFLSKGPAETLAVTLGIELKVLRRDRVAAELEVTSRVKQPFGVLHGGTSLALAETLASIGAWLNVTPGKEEVVGLELNGNHLRAVREGRIRGEAIPIHIGSRTQVWGIDIATLDGKRVCAARCTLMTIPAGSAGKPASGA